jgi:2,3-bisphosphoglycerate-dependent phosphoglycerate mutase
MNRIYFIRHGEGQDNVARRFSSTWMDHPLTERGRLQARQTGDYLSGMQVDGIFCSPMKRAHETAQIVASRLQMEVTVMPEFREANVGDLEGRDFTDQNWAIYHGVTNQWYAGNPRASFPGGEDYVTVWERTRKGYRTLLQNHENSKLVLVGHGGIFIATLKEFNPGLQISWLQNAILYNCAVTELEMDMVNGELRGRIVRWSDNDHLSGDARTTSPAIPPLSSVQEK